MEKSNFEVKLNVVQAYLQMDTAAIVFQLKNGIKFERQVRDWVNNYREFSEERAFA